MADLSAIGAKTSGTMEELTKRLAMYKRTPGLFDAMSMAKKKASEKESIWKRTSGP